MRTKFNQLYDRAKAVGLLLEDHKPERPRYELTAINADIGHEPFSYSWEGTLVSVEETIADVEAMNLDEWKEIRSF